jgi:hypothetical protein
MIFSAYCRYGRANVAIEALKAGLGLSRRLSAPYGEKDATAVPVTPPTTSNVMRHSPGY